ncbi:aminotransferase class IV family protein [Shimia thalassica]|uniref:aminotransferase class IV family protein n=1 Tax=Shimia thalassica TaxID=1715693 RepID=UPI0026E45DCC|nr:aminotransferase class IV family protein [Shimia thalassica]MDO6478436.1 aminotransferase class IV family protein [Shimia thalassica]
MESPFRHPVPDGTRLIETFGYVPENTIARLDLHLARLETSARAFGFAFDKGRVLARIEAINSTTPQRCRLTLDKDGMVDLTLAEMPAMSGKPWTVRIHPQALSSADALLGHKSTQRALYDTARAELPSDIQEWLFLNERDEVCEGTITNVAIVTPDGETLTPALACGCLPGVYRQSRINAGLWQEALLTLSDLKAAKTLVLGNALRGEIPAALQMP